MNHISKNTVQMESTDAMSHKVKFQISYFIVKDLIMLDTSPPSRRYQKFCKQVFGGQPCFATLVHT